MLPRRSEVAAPLLNHREIGQRGPGGPFDSARSISVRTTRWHFTAEIASGDAKQSIVTLCCRAFRQNGDSIALLICRSRDILPGFIVKSPIIFLRTSFIDRDRMICVSSVLIDNYKNVISLYIRVFFYPISARNICDFIVNTFLFSSSTARGNNFLSRFS